MGGFNALGDIKQSGKRPGLMVEDGYSPSQGSGDYDEEEESEYEEIEVEEEVSVDISIGHSGYMDASVNNGLI